MRFRPVIGAIALLMLVGMSASAKEKDLSPSKDNTIFESTNASAQNSNGAGDMFVGRINMASNSIRRGLIEFDLENSLPNGVTITGVTLELRETTGMNLDRDVSLHRLFEEWGQGTSFASGGGGAAATNNDATWLYAFWKPIVADRILWGTPGGVFDATPSATTTVVDDFSAPHFFAWSSAAMVTDVQSWLDSPGTNHGWLIKGVESSTQTAKRFNSGEAAEAFRPVLHVTYVPEPSTATILALIASGTSALFGRWRRND